MIRVALAAGGTAGHVYPAVAVAHELRRLGHDCLFLGSTAAGRERDIVVDDRLELLPSRPYQRTTPFGKVAALAAMPVAIAAAARILRRERIDAVIGFGGYASVGPVLAARMLGRTTAILEPNAVLGMANRLLAPFADRIYTGMITHCDSAKARRVGLPVRREIVEAARERTAHNGRPRVFLFDHELRIEAAGIHLIEATNVGHVAEGYGLCDVVVARAGAGTFAEIAVCGLPAIIVPLDAAEDHQTRNADRYARAGAAIVTDANSVAARLQELLADEERRLAMGRCAAALAAPDAARHLVTDLLGMMTR